MTIVTFGSVVILSSMWILLVKIGLAEFDC
jgi:hypothetical protein